MDSLKVDEVRRKAMAVSTGAALFGWVASASAQGVRPDADKSRGAVNVRDFGAAADGSDQTAAVQAALNTLDPEKGGIVTVPAGYAFNLKSLKFPRRSNLEYFMDSDLSRPNPLTTLGTNEKIQFAANANSQGIVNEFNFTGAYHVGLVTDVRKDVSGHDAFLGPGQSRVSPARVSWSMRDEQVNSFRVVYESHETFTNFSAASMHTFRRVVVLHGIGTTQWPAMPPENSVVIGTKSGARGFVLSVESGATTLLWYSGRFQVGESVRYNNAVSSAAIAQVVFSTTAMPALAQDFKRGFWSIGVAPGACRDAFVVGGKIAAQRSRKSSWHLDENVQNPGFVWVDSYETAPPNGFEAIYDTGAEPASRRLYLRKYDEAANRAMIGAFRAGVSFGAALQVSKSAYNIQSVGNPGIGRYVVTFATPMTRADYLVNVTASDIADRWQRCTAKEVNSFEIRNYDAAGSPAVLVGNVDISVALGDI